MSSHDLDLVSWFLNSRVTRVITHERRGVLEGLSINVHDGVDALITYQTGAVDNFHSSWIHPNSYPHITTDRMTVIGEDGLIHFESRDRALAARFLASLGITNGRQLRGPVFGPPEQN